MVESHSGCGLGSNGDDCDLLQRAGRLRRQGGATGIQIAADPAAGRCHCVFSHRRYRKPARWDDPGTSAKSSKSGVVTARAMRKNFDHVQNRGLPLAAREGMWQPPESAKRDNRFPTAQNPMSKRQRNKPGSNLGKTPAAKRRVQLSPLFFLGSAIVVLVVLISWRLQSPSIFSVTRSANVANSAKTA